MRKIFLLLQFSDDASMRQVSSSQSQRRARQSYLTYAGRTFIRQQRNDGRSASNVFEKEMRKLVSSSLVKFLIPAKMYPM